MTRSETKFQAPLNRRYQEVLAKTENLTIKTMSTGHARHVGVTIVAKNYYCDSIDIAGSTIAILLLLWTTIAILL